MAGTSDAQIAAQQPWWTTQAWPSVDPHLRALNAHPRRLPTPIADDLDLDTPAIHTLRGPRQIGKSTTLKLIAERALRAEGRQARQVIYLAMDLLEDRPPQEMAEAIVRAKQLARADGPSLLLLDEVTFVPRWRAAVKHLWDLGELRDDVVICTGSSAVDLRAGAERLPGRRGSGGDHGIWPLTFAEFAAALDRDLPPGPQLSAAELAGAAGHEAALGAQMHLPRLQQALELYLRFGGLPAAVAEAAGGAGEPSAETRRIVYDSLLKELGRRGAGAAVGQALGERLVRSLGSKLSWSSLARDLDVSHTTAREYVEHLARAYFIVPLYFWRSDSHSSNLSRDKKLYFGDPLLHAVALEHAPGLTADPPAQVENAVAWSLLRRQEPSASLVEGFDSLGSLHVWATRSGGEVDFVCGSYNDLAVVEVKYRNRIDRRGAHGIARALPGRPITIATKDTLALQPAYTMTPAALLLWMLG